MLRWSLLNQAFRHIVFVFLIMTIFTENSISLGPCRRAGFKSIGCNLISINSLNNYSKNYEIFFAGLQFSLNLCAWSAWLAALLTTNPTTKEGEEGLRELAFGC
jgi:hypothetical protein